MKDILPDVETMPASLPREMEEILTAGFNKVEDAVFFSTQFDRDCLPDSEFIESAYTDLSGYEFSVNKLHLEDYCNFQCLRAGMLFTDKFVRLWRSQFSASAIALLSYDKNPDFGEICTFRFHKKREGELIIDLEKIEEFSAPLLVVDTSLWRK
ncbi:hypothetical protein [Herbaspirillum sp. alder98]|uniref:hypothetical protein n=1 Tax=Herbaspirillum sp. alder98 TaxID=2913096 RepID=UPI001CD85E94|nr:hypothetical protein [Herbaspirillum sp. alder98]MCA1323686.1 hypothetical protein [Herbaspirillum sp. alder98]